MTEIAGTLGAGKLLVFQPATGDDAIALPVALGLQRFWGRRLKEAGRPGMRFVAVGKLERLLDGDGADVTSDEVAVGDKFVLPFPHMTDDVEPARLISMYGARWGLYSTFALTGPRFHLTTRLFEVQDEAVRLLEEHAFDEENIRLPHRLFEILVSTAMRTGVRTPWHDWSDCFTTNDEVAALHYLAADGVCSMVEEGVRMTVADAFEPVIRALAQSPIMVRGIEVVRELLRAFKENGVSDLAVARQLRRLRELGVRVDDLGE